MRNPYAARYAGYSFSAAPPRDPARERAERDASFWRLVGTAAPYVGTAAGGLIGAGLGSMAGGVGAIPGAGLGASIGGALGSAVGAGANAHGEEQLDPTRERELRKQALLESLIGMRGLR